MAAITTTPQPVTKSLNAAYKDVPFGEKEKFVINISEDTRLEDKQGHRLFVIPNINGNYKQLIELLYAIEIIGPRASNDKVVFLGDYVDYGDNSREVIDFLIKFKEKGKDSVILLKGDRDYHFAKGMRRYFSKGFFKSTYNSYRKKTYISDHKIDLEVLNKHRKFIEQLPTHYDAGDLFFSHAGVHFDLDLSKQNDYMFMFQKSLLLLTDHLEKYKGNKKLVCTLNNEEEPSSLDNKSNVFAFSSGWGSDKQKLSSAVFDEKGKLMEIIKV